MLSSDKQIVCRTDDEDTITEFMFPENERKSRDDEILHEKDHHPHLAKLLSTVGQSVTSDMDRREKVATVVAQINKKLRQSVHECKLVNCHHVHIYNTPVQMI